MKKGVFLIVFFVIIASNIFSQSNDNYSYEPLFDSTDNAVFDINKKDKISLLNKDRFSYKLSIGSSFTFFGNTNIYSSYLAPELNYKINEKFSFSVGAIAYATYFPTSVSINNEELPMNNKYRANIGIYGKGYYMPTDKLTVFGSFAYFPTSVRENDFINTTIGAEYKVTEKFSVVAGVSISKGNYYSPQNNSYFNHNFGYNFNTPFIGF